MRRPGGRFKNIEEYIRTFPPDIQKILQLLREIIQEAAPGAGEAISYGIPTFKLNGNLVHFAAYKHHIGLYPGPSAIEAFAKELSPYKLAKGTIQFPIDRPIPLELIRKIVKFRVEENLERGKGTK